jgi:glycosidase
MTYPGAPCIYYGDEIGLDGGKDPDCRKAFPWNNKSWDSEILGFTQKCISIRKAHPALRTGEFKTLYGRDDVLVYVRNLEKDQVLVVINRSDQTRQPQIDVANVFPDGSFLKHEFISETIPVLDGKICSITLAPFSGAVAFRI